METQEITRKPVLVNYLPRIMKSQGITEGQFRGMVFDAGYSSNVADRLLKGETNFNANTLFNVAQQLKLESLSDLIDIEERPAE